MFRPNKYFFPMTSGVIAVTSVMTILQFVFPEILFSLRRDPINFANGEWWRIITPLLVHSDGWIQYLFNIVCIAFLGIVVERLYGKIQFLTLYLAGGVMGEIIGYAGWDPYGAGASVGFCGLLGGLVVAMLRRKRRVHPIFAIAGLYIVVGLVGYASGQIYVTVSLYVATAFLISIFARRNNRLSFISSLVCLVGALILLVFRDIHGVAILAGVSAAFILILMREYPNRQNEV
ncbi:rhomboid family intramembrane serine protease [Bacillus sp. FJAT-49711]|uniref:rhomboid family intramembrane serine protease n=1 Tax=Bacillus sp. FJAT-49711 TaxID=2833585 RepID=UPI001BC8F05F|nr:rhomboid family intramembrane serine protease [Bacillus sp. FJAT-49711]MBS4219491.1 rhomboid family intramembrane serine protease [Bacillus sp. FJAT-49711]